MHPLSKHLTYLSSFLHAAQVFFYQIQFDVSAQTIQIEANHTSQAFIFNILKVNITLEGLEGLVSALKGRGKFLGSNLTSG